MVRSLESVGVLRLVTILMGHGGEGGGEPWVREGTSGCDGASGMYSTGSTHSSTLKVTETVSM